MPCGPKRKRAVSGTPPEIAQTLQIRIVFAEDGLRPQTPVSDAARLLSKDGTIHHKTVRCKFFFAGCALTVWPRIVATVVRPLPGAFAPRSGV